MLKKSSNITISVKSNPTKVQITYLRIRVQRITPKLTCSVELYQNKINLDVTIHRGILLHNMIMYKTPRNRVHYEELVDL